MKEKKYITTLYLVMHSGSGESWLVLDEGGHGLQLDCTGLSVGLSLGLGTE